MLELLNSLAKPGDHWHLGEYTYQKTPNYKTGDLVLYDENEVRIHQHKKPSPQAVSAGEAIDTLLTQHELLHLEWVEIWRDKNTLKLGVDDYRYEFIISIEPN